MIFLERKKIKETKHNSLTVYLLLFLLQDTVKTAGAEVSGEGIVETFHNDEEALDAADNGVVVVDLSHFGRIRVSGDDRVQFLHNQSTANFEGLQAGQD